MNSARAIDEESRRLIREELLTNILVEAGAGSGKTQMLADRMAAGVAAGIYPLEQMAAVTFTRKAASELRGRFHLALEKELENARKNSQPSDADRERISRIENALSNLEEFLRRHDSLILRSAVAGAPRRVRCGAGIHRAR